MNYERLIMNYELGITNYELRIMNYELALKKQNKHIDIQKNIIIFAARIEQIVFNSLNIN